MREWKTKGLVWLPIIFCSIWSECSHYWSLSQVDLRYNRGSVIYQLCELRQIPELFYSSVFLPGYWNKIFKYYDDDDDNSNNDNNNSDTCPQGYYEV